MSDSGLSASVNMPGDNEIEQCLKRVTRSLNKQGDVIVNQVRKAVEQELELDDGFLKARDWKTRSKDIISAVVNGDEEASSPDAKKKPPPKKPAAKAGKKRKSDEAPTSNRKPAKKAKKGPSESEASELELDDDEEDAKNDYVEESDAAAPKKRASAERKAARKNPSDDQDNEHEPSPKPKRNAPARKRSAKKPVDDVVDSEASDDEPTRAGDNKGDAVRRKRAAAELKEESELSEPPMSEAGDDGDARPIGNKAAPEDDESDMSEVIDEPPPKKQRQTKSTSESKSKTKASKPKKAAKELTPDEEEIKRLQGWLVKCGIRKLWGKELKPYDTSKAKIKHLKGMLEDTGMTGRYSNEKAKQIKEERELKAELEAVQEYDGKWGQERNGGSDDDGSEGGQVSEEEVKPAVRRPKGLVDFGDSGDDSD